MKVLMKQHMILVAFVLMMLFPAQAKADDDFAEYFELSFGHESQGNYQAALEKIKKAIQLRPNHYTAILRAGWLCYMLGENNNSIQYYKKAIQASPNAIEPRLGVMMPLMALKNWAQAEKFGREVMAIDKANYYATSRLAWILYSQGQYANALRFYQKLVELYPSDIEMKLGVGWTYLKMGKKEMAKRYFSEVLEVRRTNVRALQGMNALSQ